MPIPRPVQEGVVRLRPAGRSSDSAPFSDAESLAKERRGRPNFKRMEPSAVQHNRIAVDVWCGRSGWLLDGVAIVNDARKTETYSVPADVAIEMVRRLLQFPYPQICRHLVAAELLAALKEAGHPVSAEALEATWNARDEEALELLG